MTDHPHPTDLPPLCDRAAFQAKVEAMVAEYSPAYYSVVQEYGDRVDARIAGYVTDHGDHTEATRIDDDSRLLTDSPEAALRWFGGPPHVTAYLVRVDPCRRQDH